LTDVALIKVSEVVKEELEQLKKKGEFKSLDAVIRHYIDSSVEVIGGIFLGSDRMDTPFITTRNTRHKLIMNNLFDLKDVIDNIQNSLSSNGG